MKQKRRAGPRPDLDEFKTYEFLYEQLVVLKKSKKQLAEEIGVSQATINHWTAKYEFSVNFHSQSNIGKARPPHTDEVKLALSEKFKQLYAEGRRPINFKGREVRTCEICGTEFEVIKDSENSKQQEKTTCSRKCADRKHSLYMISQSPKVEKKVIVCKQCGREFMVFPSLAHLQFCSYECLFASRRGKTFEELYGSERADEIKVKLAKFRSAQSQIFVTRPVLRLVEALIPLIGPPELEYQIEKYTVDLCYPEAKLVIEVDGNYWHNYPDGLERDKVKNKYLEARGWKVLRYWESDILANVEDIALQIKEKKLND